MFVFMEIQLSSPGKLSLSIEGIILGSQTCIGNNKLNGLILPLTKRLD